MNLDYAIDRLYKTGWTPDDQAEHETSAEGKVFPTVLAIQQEFVQAGLDLQIKHNLIFKCFRATWGRAGEPLNESHLADADHGTVVGSCQREAAVFALAQLRSTRSSPSQLAGV